jgi:cell volume regulation protein A
VNDTQFFVAVLVVAATGLVAVVSNRLAARVAVPAPAFFFVGAAVAVKVVPVLHAPHGRKVEQVVSAALVCILFNGGLDIGWPRFRSALGPIATLGIVGTFLTAGAGAVLVHLAFGLGWYVSLLLATAVAPTDPAVVFSVLGRREAPGQSGVILEGESGANDPVGIALMASLITAGGLNAGAFGHVAGQFAVQMTVGTVTGVVGGRALLVFVRRVPLPSEGLYPLRTLASAFVLYGVASLAHGSGFLAVFIAGIILGHERVPYKREIDHFHGALASLGEIVAFTLLGLTVDLSVIARADVWAPGLLLGAALAFAIRPVLVGLCLIPAKLQTNERNFVLFAGLKGAVPILLGTFLVTAHLADAQRLYGIVNVVVMFSVVVQGGLVPAAARLVSLPMITVKRKP